MDLTDRQKDMVDNFPWQESEEGTNHIEGESLIKEINECSKSIFNDFLSTINLNNFSYDMIVVPVEMDKYPLLVKCFDQDMSDESKSLVLQSIQNSFFALAWHEMTNIVKKLCEIRIDVSDIVKVELEQNVLLDGDNDSHKMQVEITLK